MSKRHTLKTWPKYFEAIRAGDKRFELRYDDRDYSQGDLLRLEEWNRHSQEYSGRWLEAYVSYMVRAPGFDVDVGHDDDRCAIGKGWVLISIKVVRRSRRSEDPLIDQEGT